MEKEHLELVIAGAGPAGLGAAIYAARSALNFKVMDKFMAGGQIVTTEFIENYPGFKGEVSGYDLMQEIISHCRSLKINLVESAAIENLSIKSKKNIRKIFKCQGDGFEITADSLIIATGASPQRLAVKGENEFIGRGISFCATCDGALYRDRDVMVIGGGNTAIQEALFLVKFARKVYVIHRRDSLRAVKSLQNKAFNSAGIEFIWDSVIEGFSGSEHLESVSLRNVKTGKIQSMKIDGVFEYIGIKPNSELVTGMVKLDEHGFIITDKYMQTSVPGIFAAGDVRNTPLRQVITAVADGAVAATYADRYLNGI
jgi:thioredoxin reductase (NADPH)